ncbi:MAG: GTP-binding protein [Clostridia bacterium]|nr:GTP-binding protein [Clostridia bacterium]
MTKLYLITGFLGAGKTTFLEKLVRLFPDQKTALIINEFGKNGVDGTLLGHLGIAMTEIDNGSIFCSCRIEQFEEAVSAILEKHSPDLIFVEASGLADPTAVKSIFSRPVYSGLTYAGAVCLVDGARFHKVYQSNKISRMQLAVSDLVLINKTDIASPEQIADIRTIAKAQKPNRPVYETTYGACEAAWILEIGSTPADEEGTSEIRTRDLSLRDLTVEVDGFTAEGLVSFLKMFAEDTYRIKGFVKIGTEVYVADCVGPLVELRPFSGNAGNVGQITVLYGNGLSARRSILEAAGWFPQASVKIL